MITKEERAAMRARCDAATPGPWEDRPKEQGNVFITGNVVHRRTASRYWRDEDGAFCAHAREDLPRCLDEIERLQERCKSLEADLTRTQAMLVAEVYGV